MRVKHWIGKCSKLANMVEIDWSAPWFASVRTMGKDIATTENWRDARAALNTQAAQRHICNHARLPVQFVAQSVLPAATSYEAYISATGQVPTRDNLHDFFNALVWLTYPNIKARLNALQSEQIQRSGIGKSRGAARDAATLFDENAALLAVSDNPEGHALVQALRTHQWHPLFIQQRQQFLAYAGVFLFGHALMEKLVRPYKAITAHTLVCWVEPDFHGLNEVEKCVQLDQQIALELAQMEGFATDVFLPLPVLGVPGWWPEQTTEFYADQHVFRPVRQR